MERKSAKLLEDIRDAAAFIRKVSTGKHFDDYQSDRLMRQAMERNFEIIGEAIGRFARIDPATAAKIGNYQQIIAFRNVLIHGYDLIDEAQVWEVVQKDVPTLEAEVLKLIAEADPE